MRKHRLIGTATITAIALAAIPAAQAQAGTHDPATRVAAVVTAELWEKGTCTDGSAFDDKLWFSDTYAKRSGTWQYVFGQASRPL